MNRKIVHIGNLENIPVFIKIEWNGSNLSITGVEGPDKFGNCSGGCGQIVDNLSKYIPANGLTKQEILKIQSIWKMYHLNNMQPACEHQRNLGWDKEKIDPTKDTGWHIDGKTANLKSWAYPPIGHLTEECPVCGYKYGTKWLRKEVPQDVIEFLFSLPNTDVQPAWI